MSTLHEPTGSPKPILSSREEELLEDVEQLAAATSHDLRDPLREVLALCEQEPSAATPTLQAITQHVEATLRRLTLMREYGYLVENTERVQTVELDVLLHEALHQCQPLISAKGARITADKLPKINGRLKQLRTLFFHLVENGLIHNTSSSPTLQITTATEANIYRITVEDNGSGLTPEYRHLIFRLFRTSSTASDTHMGAGLAFCRKIAQNHGASLQMESFPSHYMRMHILFPAEIVTL
jgi:light-regulated signal transduction histidine kinase (bacteriophytochrome)